MHTLYLGPSWAVQSFETPMGEDLERTNLAEQLQLSTYTNLARCGENNFQQLHMAREFMAANPDLAPYRAVFVTANSITHGHILYDTVPDEFVRYFLTHSDVVSVVQDLETKFYQELTDLNIPVALIGAHTDVVPGEWSNLITVIHHSWQNFLAKQSGLRDFFGWSADVAHRWLHDTDVQPSVSTVAEISLILDVWGKLERRRVFCGVHPNIQGNGLIKPAILYKLYFLTRGN
jgi:hypothetical protein